MHEKNSALIVYTTIIFSYPFSEGAMNSTLGRDSLSTVIKDNQPRFYIDDKEFTHRLPKTYKVSIWIQDLSILGQNNDPNYGLIYYPDIMMPVPRDASTCFYIPKINTLKLDNPYNIRTSFEYRSDICLVSHNNQLIATSVNLEPDPKGIKNAKPVCSSENFKIEKTFWQKIKNYFYSLLNLW